MSLKEKNKKFNEDHPKAQGIIISCLMALLGVLFILMPSGTGNVICYIIGVSLIVFGCATIIAGVTSPMALSAGFGVGGGIVSVLFGILFLTIPGAFQIIASIILAVSLFANGIATVSRSVVKSKMGFKSWFVELIIGILFAALGITALFTLNKDFAVMYAGIVLIATAVIKLIITASLPNTPTYQNGKKVVGETIDMTKKK